MVRFVGTMAALASSVLAGCMDLDVEGPFKGELVVGELVDGLIDFDVSNGVVRWTSDSVEGKQLHEAPLASSPIRGRDNPASGTTVANLLVDGDAVYVADHFGVSKLTDQGATLVAKDDFISRITLADDHGLVWGHVGFVSWFEPGGVSDAFLDVGNILTLVSVGDVIYASTLTTRLNGLQFSTLYRIDTTTRATTLIGYGSQFASEFTATGPGAQYLACGLHEVAGRVYWCIVANESGIGPRPLLAEVTERGLELALPPQPVVGSFVAYDDRLYWSTAEEIGRSFKARPLWELVPGEAPRRVLEDTGLTPVVFEGGYVYGTQLSGYDELEVRRVPLP